MANEQILSYFSYDHLPDRLKVISKPFCELAHSICNPELPLYLAASAERSVTLRKLLEAKDAAVRAALG